MSCHISQMFANNIYMLNNVGQHLANMLANILTSKTNANCTNMLANMFAEFAQVFTKQS